MKNVLMRTGFVAFRRKSRKGKRYILFGACGVAGKYFFRKAGSFACRDLGSALLASSRNVENSDFSQLSRSGNRERAASMEASISKLDRGILIEVLGHGGHGDADAAVDGQGFAQGIFLAEIFFGRALRQDCGVRLRERRGAVAGNQGKGEQGEEIRVYEAGCRSRKIRSRRGARSAGRPASTRLPSSISGNSLRSAASRGPGLKIAWSSVSLPVSLTWTTP